MKLKYEKPKSVDIGKAAAVIGATCSSGDGATDGCHSFGNNPAVQYYCDDGGSADGNCTVGNTAGAYCDHGAVAGAQCVTGGSTG